MSSGKIYSIRTSFRADTFYVNDLKQTPLYVKGCVCNKLKIYSDLKDKLLTKYETQNGYFFSYFKLSHNCLAWSPARKVIDIPHYFVQVDYLWKYKSTKIKVFFMGGCLVDENTGKYLILTVTKNAEDFVEGNKIDCKDNADIIVYISDEFFNKEYNTVRKALLPLFEDVQIVKCPVKFIENTFFKNPLCNIKIKDEENFNKILEKGNNLLLESLEEINTDLKQEKIEADYLKEAYFRLENADEELIKYELSVCPYSTVIKILLFSYYPILDDYTKIFNTYLNRYLTQKDMI
jgi:hypothetical protein